jgi:hypothetical protein
VRRSQQPFISLILLITGVVAALPVQVALGFAFSTFDWIQWVAAVAVLAESGWVFMGKPTPWSVNQQVPQSWGHDHGPWKAALRYGFRLGVGPATILNSWSWWGGAVLATHSLRLGVAFVVSFVSVRSLLIVLMPGHPPDGLVLAKRMAAIRSAESSVKYLMLLVAGVATASWALG